MGWIIFIYLLIYVVIGIAFGFGARAAARAKGLSDSWFWMGFFFTAAGLIVVACIPAAPAYNTTSAANYRVASGYGTPKRDGNEWVCPKCKSVNSKLFSTCDCGCTLEAYYQDKKREEMANKRRAEEERARQREEMDNQKKIEKKDAEWIENLKKTAELAEITPAEELIIRTVKMYNDGISFPDIVRKLPRHADISEYKKALEHLDSLNYIYSDEQNRYYFNSAKTETSSEQKEPSDDKEQKTVIDPKNTSYDKYDEVRKLKALFDDGIISEEEFTGKKRELLGL